MKCPQCNDGVVSLHDGDVTVETIATSFYVKGNALRYIMGPGTFFACNLCEYITRPEEDRNVTIPYDLDGLKERARDRCIAEGIVPTCLAIYHMVPTLRKEELLRNRDPRETVLGETVDVDCVELPPTS